MSYRVLVVDDSAYVRKLVSQMLASHGELTVVGTARDGRDAQEQVVALQPDVITLDLGMPVMDGLAFLQSLNRAVPVVVVSIATDEGSRVLAALDAGAVDFVRKPTALATERIYQMQDELVGKVLAAARARPPRLEVPAPSAVPALSRGRYRILLIAASTGGPQAIRGLLAALPARFPVPIAVLVHMPVGFTALFAQRLDSHVELEVEEASEGLPLQPGRVVVARAGAHLEVVDDRCHLNPAPAGTHVPSADVMFRSAAEAYRDGVLAVVLTGMGCDGLQGAGWIKAAGGTVLAEAEESCVVYGMPRAVIEAGLADKAVALPAMPEAILGEFLTPR